MVHLIKTENVFYVTLFKDGRELHEVLLTVTIKFYSNVQIFYSPYIVNGINSIPETYYHLLLTTGEEEQP